MGTLFGSDLLDLADLNEQVQREKCKIGADFIQTALKVG